MKTAMHDLLLSEKLKKLYKENIVKEKRYKSDYSDLYLFLIVILLIFPAISKTLSKIKLIHNGTSNNETLKQHASIISKTMNKRISREILRKCIDSFSDNGFSGVSSGQKTNMLIADTALIISNTI